MRRYQASAGHASAPMASGDVGLAVAERGNPAQERLYMVRRYVEAEIGGATPVLQGDPQAVVASVLEDFVAAVAGFAPAWVHQGQQEPA